MRLFNRFGASVLALGLAAGCATTRPEQQPAPPPPSISIEDYLAELLRASQNEVQDPRDFTIIHDDVRETLRRFDQDGDGIISSANPLESKSFDTIAELRRLGVSVLVGDPEMTDLVMFDHNDDVIYINPGMTDPREAARALAYYLDKNKAFWGLEARGWRPPAPTLDIRSAPVDTEGAGTAPSPDN